MGLWEFINGFKKNSSIFGENMIQKSLRVCENTQFPVFLEQTNIRQSNQSNRGDYWMNFVLIFRWLNAKEVKKNYGICYF